MLDTSFAVGAQSQAGHTAARAPDAKQPIRRRGRSTLRPVTEPRTIDRWTLLDQLGAGGNADVWRATDGDREVALKVLKTRRPDSEQYARFRNEVGVLQALRDEQGILPILEASLPDQPSRDRLAWIAMPLARLIRPALEDATLSQVVSAIRDIADTLARVAERGIAHRDLKPENLYQYDGRWVVGDFGIAHVPTTSERRLTDRRLGPFGYMPDESITNAAAADPFRIDVFQLAKCLLVLGAGLPDPPQGTIEAGTSGALSRFVAEPRADVLDGLIERCTRREPDLRPGMADVARELTTWLEFTPPAEPQDIADIAARFRHAHRDELDLNARDEAWKLRLEEIVGEVESIVVWVTEALRAAGLTPEIAFWHERSGWVERTRHMGMQPQLASAQRWATAQFGSAMWPTTIVIGMGVDLDVQGEFWCQGHIAWGDLVSSATLHVPVGERTAPIESLEIETVIAALRGDVQEGCREMLAALIEDH